MKVVRTPAERTIRMDGVDISVMTTGPDGGVPLVLISGLGTSMHSWAALRAGLSDRRRVVMFDLPDNLRRGAAPVRMRGQARRVSRLLESMGIDRADVLGYSWGGALAQQLVLDDPERVRGVVLAATNYGLGSLPVAPGPLLRLLTGRARSGESLAGYLSMLWPGATGPGGASVAVYAQQLYAFSWWSSVFRLRSVRHPTLVVAGDQDPLIPVCTTRTLGRAIPGARITVLRDAGHSFLLFDRAEEASRVVEAFLQTLDDQSRRALRVAAVS